MTAIERPSTPSVVKKILQGDLILVIVLAVEIIVMSLLSNKFFTVYNLLNMTRNFVEIGIVALSMTFVILTSGIDLSVGSLVGMNAMILGTLSIRSGINIWLTALIVIAISVFAGFINGTVITRIKVPPLVVTLATMSVFRGLAYSVSDAKTFSGFPESFSILGQGTLFNTNIPVQLLIFAVLALLFFIIMNYTRFGRNVYVIGNNEKTALFSGINVNRVKVILYIISGFLCGIASVIMVSRVSAARADLATGFELDVITAVLVGGTSIAGGKGSVGATILGFFIIIILRNGLSLAGFSTLIQTIFVGIVLILSVYLRTVKLSK
jgi:rhamnose transport system permease protein